MPLSTELLLHRAGAKSYWRGLRYRDAVQELHVYSRHVAARVRGNEDYSVSLSWDGSVLVGECTCPHGDEGFFCKHCVAVGLHLLRTADAAPDRSSSDSNVGRASRSVLASRTDTDVCAGQGWRGGRFGV